MTPSLSQLETAFAADFPIQHIAPTDDAPSGQLAVVLDPDGQGRERTLFLLLTPPLHDEDLSGLQLFALLPFQAQPGRFGELARLLLLINAALPLIGFGLGEENGLVFFRCVLPVAQGRVLDSSEALYAAWLIYSCLDRFGDIIEGVAVGAVEYVQARQEVESALTTLDGPK